MRALAIVALASGCGFSLGDTGSGGNGGGVTTDAPPGVMIDAPATPGIDAAPPIDAPPDAPPDAAPVPTWTVVDTLTVPCSGTPVTSAVVTLPTVMYRFTASGTCVINTLNGSRGDAEYGGYNITNPPVDAASGVDLGLAINDLTPGSSKLPDWGVYSSSHIYTSMSMGTGATITAKFHDAEYDNNSGSLTLTILAFQ